VCDTLTLPVTVPLAVVRGINAYYFPKGEPAPNTEPAPGPARP
jgi:hypothetical protein